MKQKHTIYLIWVFALLAVGTLAGFQLKDSAETTAVAPTAHSDDYYANLQKLNQVVEYVNQLYFEDVDNEQLIDDAINGMLGGLDPHSYYITREEMEAVNESMQGHFYGIGIEFNLIDDTIFVVTPLSGGPSERLGIMAGDRIVRVDEEVVAGVGFTNQDVHSTLRGPRGSKVSVTIRRKGVRELLTFDITRDEIPITSVDYSYMIRPQVGYIKVSRFAQKTFIEFREALTKLKNQGMESLVLDLRGNPGGYLGVAQQMADDFISEGRTIVSTRGRIPQSNGRYEASTLFDGFEKGALVILIDEGSASASEIVSGAVQDWDRGLIVGTRSFGKGLVQDQRILTDGSAIRVVISRYYTPSGRCIQKDFAMGDDDAYNAEIMERYKRGELYDASKIEMPDSLRFTTHSGRAVYGGGGIVPDVFVPNDTSYFTNYYFNLVSRVAIGPFTLRYVDANPGLRDKYASAEDFVANYRLPNEVLQSYVDEGVQAGLTMDAEELKRSRDLLENRLKAWIGHAIYGDDGTYPVYHLTDNQLSEALRLLPVAQELEQTGKVNLSLVEGR